MRWAIRHRTTFRYDGPVQDSFNEVRLKPVTNHEQRLETFQLSVQPAAPLDHHLDFYGNWVDHFDVFEPHTFLEMQTQAVVETNPPLPLPENFSPAPMARLRDAAHSEQCFDFIQASRFTDTEPATWRLAMDATQGQTDVWQSALAIMRFVHDRLEYEPFSTNVHTHMRDALAHRRGVCQDFAHAMIGLSRSVHIPARYVSGYLATQRASATHAWIEVFIPSIGWRGLDPTHNSQPNETYVKIAVGRDYNDVPPVRGTYRGTLSRRMEVNVQITPAEKA
jgi:transglutaminase-like putative cysteine protease